MVNYHPEYFSLYYMFALLEIYIGNMVNSSTPLMSHIWRDYVNGVKG